MFGASKSGTTVEKSSTPVQVPKDVAFPEPKTVVQAKASAQIRSTGEKMVVTYVGDGDGANLVKKDGSKIACRIDTIDAPEVDRPKYKKVGQPGGESSRKTLEQMILSKEVTVRITKAKKPGQDREYCQVELEGAGVDQKMVEAGAAWVYERYGRDPALMAAQDSAKKAKRGIWGGDTPPENPEAFRRRMGY